MVLKNGKTLKFSICLTWFLLFSLSVFTLDSNNCVNIKDVEHLIKIPIIRQGAHYTCGVAALQAVLLYYNRSDREYQWLCEDDLSEELNTTEENGTDYYKIVEVAQKKGLKAKAQFNMTIDSLIKAINDKKMVICDIQAWAKDKQSADYESKDVEGHYVVAIGYDDNNIYFMDPWTVGNYAYIPQIPTEMIPNKK
jgi:predicted double-glycine peptidase